MDSPTISVVMSVFNGQTFLQEAVDSILSQTFMDFEFVIIDDGSTDKTAEILATYAQQDGRIRIHRQENKGRTVSLNAGIGFAKGKYIARMDADDISLPERLQQQVDFMDKNPAVGLLGGGFEQIDASGQVLDTVRFPLEDSEIKRAMAECNPLCHPAVFMRKDVMLATGQYRIAFGEAEDYDLWLRMSERTQLANLSQIILRYRIHASQVSISNMRLQVLCVLAARAASIKRRTGQPDPLSDVTEITPQVVEALGVKSKEIKQALLDVYRYWMNLLAKTNPERALQMNKALLALASSEDFSRAIIADAWVRAAIIEYRRGEFARALVSAGRAFLVRPTAIGGPIRRAFSRLAAGSRS
jgi:Glycosyl transferase family 2